MFAKLKEHAVNPLFVTIGGAIAACGVAIPAVLGLSGNPSFSQRIPVPVPSQAHRVHYDDGTVVAADSSSGPASRTTASQVGQAETSDDHGGARSSTSSEPEPERHGSHTATRSTSAGAPASSPVSAPVSTSSSHHESESEEPTHSSGRSSSSGRTSSSTAPSPSESESGGRGGSGGGSGSGGGHGGGGHGGGSED